MIKPDDFRKPHQEELPNGEVCSSDDIWEMLSASRGGDLEKVQALVSRCPGLVSCEYNYTPPLHFAVREGHLPIVRLLLDRGVDPSPYRSYPFKDSFLTMAEDREYHEIARLLREHADKRFPVAEDVGPLLEAARAGDLARVKTELARNPALAGASNDVGTTALHEAAFGGHLQVMTALLDAGASVDAVRGDGHRPITAALRHRPPMRAGMLVGLLLGRGATYTIYIAAVLGDMTFVREALASDPALANFEDSSHQRPISAAARRNDLEMVTLLLRHGANPNLPEEGAPRGSALWIATYQQQRDMVKLLLDHGADPNGSVDSGGRVTDWVRGDEELERWLVEHGAVKQSVRQPDRLTQLVEANDVAGLERLLQEQPDLVRGRVGIMSGPARDGRRDLVDLLARYGARVEDVSLWARYYYFKHADVAAVLLAHGMNPNHMTWQHVTLLHDMAHEGDIPKARLLLDRGADINAVDEEYRSTPLGVAARFGNREMVSFLLERGADPNKAGAPWATPLAWARKKGHADLEALLRQAGAQ